MIYILKFGASLLMPPGVFILIFLALGIWLWRKNEKRAASVVGAATIVFYLLSTFWISGILIGSLENKYSMPEGLDGDCIVMLGGGALSGTPALDGEGTLSGAAASRMALVAQLYKKTIVTAPTMEAALFSFFRQSHIPIAKNIKIKIPGGMRRLAPNFNI